MRCRVVINADAGSVDDLERLRAEIVGVFAAAGGRAEVDPVDAADIGEVVRVWWAAEDRPDVIVVAGGDGTVNAAAAAAVGADIVLSVLPLGTFNHFAGDLGIPDDLAAAAAAIVDGEVRTVDVAEVNGEVFVNNSAIGVYPTMVAIRDRIRATRGWGKVRAVPVACVAVLRALPVHRLDLTGPDGFERRRVRTPFVFVGNGRYDNGRGGRAVRDDIDDGLLQLSVARVVSRWGLIRTAARALVSGAAAARDLDQVSLPEVTISSRTRRLRVARDGEVGWMELPLLYRCRPDALHVRAPVRGGPDVQR